MADAVGGGPAWRRRAGQSPPQAVPHGARKWIRAASRQPQPTGGGPPAWAPPRPPRRAGSRRGPARLRPSPRSFQLREPLRLVAGDQRIDDLVQLTVHDPVDLVEREVDAVVRHAPLREVVGADPLGAVARADLALALGGALGIGFRALHVVEARPQHLQRLGLVLVLRLLVLLLDDDAGRQMRDAHGAVGRVDRLPAG